MKTYSNSEVMTMLQANRTLKFESKQEHHDFIIEVIGARIVMKSENGLDGGFDLYDKWTLVQEPVTFMEAINADIKLIKYEPWAEYHTVAWVLKNLGVVSSDQGLERINGKWFIQEDDEYYE